MSIKQMVPAIMFSISIFATAHAGTIVNLQQDYPVYWAKVVRVIDGDSLVAQVDLWPGLTGQYHIRVRDIQAPEIRGYPDCPEVKIWGIEAKQTVETLYDVGSRIRIENVDLDSFGRVLADVSRWRSDRWLYLKAELLGSRLNQIQNAMRVANATADRKFLASLS